MSGAYALEKFFFVYSNDFMTKFESSVKHISYTQEQVYNKLSDLNNLSAMKERLEMVKEQIGDKLKDIEFDQDSLTMNVQGMNVTLRIVEREPMKCIKFEGEKTPIPVNLWIQILPEGADCAKLKVTIGAELNFFIKKMAEKPLNEGAEKIAEMLSMIKY